MLAQKILVIDDEPDNYDVVASLLHRESYELLYANNAERARTLLPILSPDLILLDIMMPGTDGIEFCAELKNDESTEHIPIVMMTALDDKAALSQAFENGADDYLHKPVSGVELRARIRSLLRLRAQWRETRLLVRRQEVALEQLRRMLTTSLPHELRTPLFGILGPLQILREECASYGNPLLEEMIDCIESSGDRMQAMVERLLLFLRLEAIRVDGDIPVAISGADVHSALQLAVQSISWEGREKDLEMEIEGLDAEVALDAGHLQHLFREILDNARKFSPAGTPCRVTAAVYETRVELRISDRGRGMKLEQFEDHGAFVQFDREAQEQQGIGLGLAIARQIISQLPGATMGLAPSRNGGTTVVISLPRL
jgi:DNA-binding response OmpR family regulator